jgi:hypothetical protein
LLASLSGAEPGDYSPRVFQGETFVRVLTWKDGTGALVNLTGYTAVLQIRNMSTRALVRQLTQASGLTLGGVAGTITWTLTATQTTALPLTSRYQPPQRLTYSLKLTSGTSVVTALLAGEVIVEGP